MSRSADDNFCVVTTTQKLTRAARELPRAAGLLALALLATVSACASTADGPPPESSYAVTVDLFSGRENPQVALSDGAAEQLYGDLDARAAEFQAAAEPPAPLGFRGFVVDPPVDARPVLRVTQDAVYSVRGQEHRKLADPSGRYYRLVLDDVTPHLAQDVRAALP
ncbi:hypothetical protein [Catellatospora sp. NPDC049609]|uniref:hypothetical protein n=1 Tax=Catellatospora sp. NPDC049609 TaxID=3155505 RepID=UPI003441B47A